MKKGNMQKSWIVSDIICSTRAQEPEVKGCETKENKQTIRSIDRRQRADGQKIGKDDI